MTGDCIKLGEDQTLRIVASSAEALELRSTWASSERKPPRHYHPNQDERFEVLEGRLTVELGSDPARVLRTGDVLEVPRGTAHRMWNAGPEAARATWTVTPGLRTAEMFGFMDKGMSPLRVANLLWTFRHEYRLALRR